MATLRTILSKLLAVGLLVAVGFALVATVVQPLATQHSELDDSITAQRQLLGRLLASASENSLADARARKSGVTLNGPVFLDGESDAIRIAGLQSKLSEAAQGVGARLSSTQGVAPRDDNNIRLVGVQTQLSATLENLQKFIHNLETARPPLFVETLNVSRGPDRDGQDADDLDIRLMVLGATPNVVEAP